MALQVISQTPPDIFIRFLPSAKAVESQALHRQRFCNIHGIYNGAKLAYDKTEMNKFHSETHMKWHRIKPTSMFGKLRV